MCIAIITTTHPTYRFIILNNRDEFLSRPTAPATWWSARPSDGFTNTSAPSVPVLSARDLARPAHGTWLGINKVGRVGVLTNCLETDCARAIGGRSRGSVIREWLTSCPCGERVEGQDRNGNGKEKGSIEEFVDSLADLGDVGGFNLLIGDMREADNNGRGLAIISNRSTSGALASDSAMLSSGYCAPAGEARAQLQVRWVDWGGIESGPGETIALSNMTLGDDDHQQKWKKVSLAEKLTAEAVGASLRAGDDEDVLVERLFDVLSTDTLPRVPGGLEESVEAYLGLLRESIYIPVIGKAVQHGKDKGATVRNPSFMEGLYGTQTQTVMLIGHDGRVRLIARTLYDEGGRRLSGEEGERRFDFVVEMG